MAHWQFSPAKKLYAKQEAPSLEATGAPSEPTLVAPLKPITTPEEEAMEEVEA